MKNRRVFTGILGLTGTAIVATVSCRESTSVPSVANRDSLAISQPYAAIQLHQRNPMDWFGRLHNSIIQQAILEIRDNSVRGWPELCKRISSWIDTASALVEILPSDRSEARWLFAQSGVCAKSSNARRVLFTPMAASVVTGNVDSVFALIDAAVDAATTPTNLASLLSPILNDAPLFGEDSIAVQAQVSLAQSSFEEWYGGTAIESMFQSFYGGMEPCLDGQMEDEEYQLGDVMYVCQGSAWRQASWRQRRRDPRPLFFSVANPSATMSCSYQIDWRSVGKTDVTAGAGGLLGLISTGQIANPGAVLAVGFAATSTSLVHGTYSAIEKTLCWLFS